MTRARPLDLGDPGVRHAWSDLVTASGASPFASLDYAEAAASAFGLRPVAVGVERDGRLVGAVVAYEKKRGPYRLAVVPPLTPVTPFVLAAPPEAADVHARASPLDALIAGLDGRFHALAFRLQPEITDVRPFTWAGYTASPRYTYAQALGPEAERLDRASRSLRKTVRRHADAFALSEDPEALDALRDAEADVYARQGETPPVDPERQAALLRPLLATGLARLFVLRDTEAGATVGAVAAITDGRTAALTCGGARPGAAMTVLLHLACERLHADGVRSVDLVGANRPSVAEFKRSFGMPLVTQFYVTRVRRPELRALALVRPVV